MRLDLATLVTLDLVRLARLDLARLVRLYLARPACTASSGERRKG